MVEYLVHRRVLGAQRIVLHDELLAQREVQEEVHHVVPQHQAVQVPALCALCQPAIPVLAVQLLQQAKLLAPGLTESLTPCMLPGMIEG